MSQSQRRSGQHNRARLPRKAGTWLRFCSGPAGQLVQKARNLHALQKKLATILPEPLVSHVQVIAIKDDRLALAADSAVWASQLRHRRSAILQHMTPAGHSPLQRLEIKISPLYAPPVIRNLNRHLTAETARNLELTARTIDDPELSAALQHLARHASKKSGGGDC